MTSDAAALRFEAVGRVGLIALALIGGLAAFCSSATAQQLGRVANARAFIAALNTADRSGAVGLLAPTVRFATADNPWVVYRGRARYDFVSSSFGENCALKAMSANAAGSRVVRVRVVLRADRAHPCIQGQRGVRVLFTMTLTRADKIAAMRITDL
jgi:hypothetical protein